MQIPHHITTLIEKFQAGQASPEEIRLLNEWYRSFDDSETTIDSGTGDSEQLLKERIQNRLLQTIRSNKKQNPVYRMRKWRWAAAAAVLLLLTGAGYVYFFAPGNNSETGPQTASIQPALNEIVPGGNKAILTLSNGSKIELDSTQNGFIRNEGNSRVEKQASGQLAYTMTGKNMPGAMVYNMITTPRGGQYQVTLSDGTKVWLNAASSLRFPVNFSGNNRTVEMTGEAYFEVAHDKSKPFLVNISSPPAGGGGREGAVEVLGTHFNINAYNDESYIKTTLLEGKVQVSAAGKTETKTLSPGQQSAQDRNGTINVTDNADTEEALAWKNGRFQFKSADLKSIFRQISRWYDVDIVYTDDADLHFTGQLTRNSNVSKVLEKLALTGEVHLTVQDRKIIVSR